MMTAIAVVPLLGAVALAVDYSQLSHQRASTMHALDAAGLATARRIAEGATDDEAKTYAKDFFEANLGPVAPSDTTLYVTLPTSTVGGGLLKLSADLKYRPYFIPTFQYMLGKQDSEITRQVDFKAHADIRLKNTLEVALVLDNSGSMDYIGTGSGEKRITLLKSAAKELVTTLSNQAAQMKQVAKPVQFGLVPFAGAVNVGPGKATASWMDTEGRSSVHHENFNWGSINSTNKKVQLSGGVYKKIGSDWKTQQNQTVTRFTLFDDLQRKDGTEFVKTGTETYCKRRWDNGTCREWGTRDTGYEQDILKPFASWQGCVEMRPAPYTFSASTPVSTDYDSYYVPMFAPDETDRTSNSRPANNNWWKDNSSSTDDHARQRSMAKYYVAAADGTNAMGLDEGPNASCTTKPITPLTDVTSEAGLTAVKAAIDEMAPLGATNVPQGIVWGWNVVSGAEPFSEGRPDTDRGNDKVVIVLTDGENTYYPPDTVTAYKYSGEYWNYGGNNLAGRNSLYSAYGYAAQAYNGGHTRLFRDTSSTVKKNEYTKANYSVAMNEHMAKICTNAKAGGVVVMTVALDLDPNNDLQKKQIEALKSCASPSRFKLDADGNPAKLFYNATSGDLDATFKSIADELSNLRIVG